MALCKSLLTQSWQILQPFLKLGLTLNSPELALICRHRECRYALQQAIKHVYSHLWEKHGITNDEHRGLMAYLRSLHLADPRTLSPREDGGEPHPDLARYVSLFVVHAARGGQVSS